MLWKYDKAIVDDLSHSFNPENVPNPVVRVIDPENAVSVAAQLQDDTIQLPVIVLTREPDAPIDTTRTNFTRIHKGFPTVYDNETNTVYYEKSLPVQVNYNLTVLCSNTADMDELVRELLFKYTSMYFLSIQLPYESKRTLRFGVAIDFDKGIEKVSGTPEYFKSGTLYQSIIPLRCEGCVLLSYTPRQNQRILTDTTPNVE